jgi:hypothetical protein
MSGTARLFASAILLTTGALAQVGGPRWVEKAWDAYRNPTSDSLTQELREATSLSSATPDSEPYAYVQTLFDVLIRNGASVPLDVLLQFQDGWPAEVAILLSRLDGETPGYEDALLALRDRHATRGEWLAVNNLLYRIQSPRFFEKTLSELELSHRFNVEQSGGQFALMCGGGFGCGIPQRKLPAGLPPIGLYYLEPEEFRSGATMLAIAGPVNVYYGRAVVQPDGTVVSDACDPPIDSRQVYRVRYLAARAGMKAEDAFQLFQPVTKLVWTTAASIAQEMEDDLNAQASAVRQFVNTNRSAFGQVSGIRLKIEPRVTDVRDAKDEPVPQPCAIEIVLE